MGGKEMLFFVLLIIAVVDCNKSLTSQTGGEDIGINTRPIIGVVTQKTTKKFTPLVESSDTYLASSYVKYLESSGAQVVPILSTFPKKKVLYIVKRINAVLFPGGAAPLEDSGYANVTQWIYAEAIKMNDDGIHFPLWGTCLGFEALVLISSGKEKKKVLSDFDVVNFSNSVTFKKEAFRSRMLQNFDMDVIRAMMFTNLTFHSHKFAISPDVYDTNPNIKKVFKVLGLGSDRLGKEFISIIEGIKYPFYGTQFHPEKAIFEWDREIDINHSLLAIKAAQLLGDFFVNEARKNQLRFESYEKAEKYVIFRYSPIYSGGQSVFEQVYTFDKDGPVEDNRVVNG